MPEAEAKHPPEGRGRVRSAGRRFQPEDRRDVGLRNSAERPPAPAGARTRSGTERSVVPERRRADSRQPAGVGSVKWAELLLGPPGVAGGQVAGDAAGEVRGALFEEGLDALAGLRASADLAHQAGVQAVGGHRVGLA